MIHASDLGEWEEVRVKWRDAFAPHSGWHEIDEYEPEDAIAITVGRYWKECIDHYVTIVGTVFFGDNGSPKTVGDINHIPLGWIVDIERI